MNCARGCGRFVRSPPRGDRHNATFVGPWSLDVDSCPPTRRVLMGIFGRASAQIGAGVAAGLTIAAIVEAMTTGGNLGGRGLVSFPVVVGVIFAVGLMAAAGPARRGWRCSRRRR